MERGVYSPTEQGTPQGGNLSPLLSNVMLNELDKELQNRGLRYVRNADDCVIRGWINYFSIGSMKKKIEKIDEHLRTTLRKVIWKQWKTPQKRAWGLRKLGIDKDLAKLTSYCGNRYEWVVRRTSVVLAISKEILTRRGLVSCLDYYLQRHVLKTNQTAVCRTACAVV